MMGIKLVLLNLANSERWFCTSLGLYITNRKGLFLRSLAVSCKDQ